MKRATLIIYILAILIAAPILAQDTQSDRVTVELTDPSKPVSLALGLVNGSITIDGYDGKTVIVEATSRAKRLSKRQSDKKGGMFRIPVSSSSMTVEERNNVIEIETSSHRRAVDISIKMPRRANLQLSTVNQGNITVNNIEGEIEAENINGSVTLTGISGSVVGHSHNKDIRVVFTEITPNKPMSFASFNGDVDITFPVTFNADVMFQNEQGEVYSDFTIEKIEKPRQVVEKNRGEDGRYRVRIENAYYGKIGKGGPEFKFTNYNGEIYLRKAK
ncbi:DUF4097 family beta strand repeat protein [bacterium]|nr:DUF4097 family beta strand repeat protein [bacterium]